MADEKKNPQRYDDLYKARMDAAESVRGLGRIAAPTSEEVAVNPAQRTTTYQDLYKAYYDSPISKEEEERRKHAATQVNAVRHLGNAMNAFSNLIFTGGAAPSQTLPTLSDPNLQAYSDKLRAARNQYGDAIIKGHLADDADYRQQKAEEMQNRAYNDKVRQQNFENQLKPLEADAKAKQMEADAIKERANNDLAEREFAEKQKRADQSNSLAWANHNLSKQRLNQDKFLYENGYKGSTRRNYTGSGKGESLANGIDSEGNWYTIDTAKLSAKGNITPLRTIYNRLPESIREKYDREIMIATPNNLAYVYQNAIGDAIESDATGAVVEELKRGGYATPYRMMNGGEQSPTGGSWLQQQGFGNKKEGEGSFLGNLNKK